MIDVVKQLKAIEREVGEGQLAAGEARVVRLRRAYGASIDEVWDALTSPERIGRWFLPVSGDFRVGGRYQLEGNAGGEILVCERPNRLRISWVYGEPTSPTDRSEVEVRLTSAGDESTILELEHVAIVPDEMWQQFGPGAVGVGWDGGMMGLALHLEGGEASIEDRDAWPLTDEGRQFYGLSSEAWGEANRTAGADPAIVSQNVAATTAFYTTAPE